MSAQPLRMRRDYGGNLAEGAAGDVNPYLNTPPTELKRMIEKERNFGKKKRMQEALMAWRLTVPGPFWGEQNRSYELRELAERLAADYPIAVDEMDDICSVCAEKMRERRITKIRASVLFPELRQAQKWESLPKGWTQESAEKFWKTLTGRASKHKVSACIRKLEGKVSDAGAFCASLADRILGTTKWRGED